MGRGDKAEQLLPSPLSASGELSSRRSLCLAAARAVVGCCSGDALEAGVAGGEEKGLRRGDRKSGSCGGFWFRSFTSPLCTCPSEGETLGRTSWGSQVSRSVEAAQERGPGE